MKKITVLTAILLLILCACQPSKPKNAAESTPPGYDMPGEMRAVWLSFYEFPSTDGLSAGQYAENAAELFAALHKKKINTVFLHVRAFCDAFYPSGIFPFSAYAASGGKEPGYDPLAILIAAAKAQGIGVHAWINPFRVSLSADTASLPEGSPAKKLLENENTRSAVCALKSGIYLNPASLTAQQLILDGVRELIDGYDIDGVHIDDYFYPETSKKIDEAEYEKYISDGGKSPLDQWRRNTVSAFVASLCSLVHKSGGLFSISPAANIGRNYSELYADVEAWLSQPGFADLIIPQIYYGFNNGTLPFADCAGRWAALKRDPSVRLVCGLGAYKCGKADDGTKSGRNEWLENSDILARQLCFIRKSGSFSGFSLFSCGSVIAPEGKTAKKEINALVSLCP